MGGKWGEAKLRIFFQSVLFDEHLNETNECRLIIALSLDFISLSV